MRSNPLPQSLPLLLALAAIGCGPPIQYPTFTFGGGASGPGAVDGGTVFAGDAGVVCVHPTPGPTSSEPVVLAAVPPPPISGGTLIIAHDGKTAIAADPERDRVWAVDLSTQTLVADFALQLGDEPGRLTQDAAGLVHVLLRRTGAVATLDLSSGQLVARRPVCSSPRGILYDAGQNALQIACADGRLVTLPTTGTSVLRTLWLDPDLRDVVASGDRLMVSRFRSAEVLVIAPTGAVEQRLLPPRLGFGTGQQFEPEVAWRMVSLPSGDIGVVHQTAFPGVVELGCTPDGGTGGYGASGGRPAIVGSALSYFQGPVHASAAGGCLPVASVLPVDLAVSPDGTKVAVAAAGDKAVLETTAASLPADATGFAGNCAPSAPNFIPYGAEPTAVAYDGQNRLIVLTREPALYVGSVLWFQLPGVSKQDSGHSLFHRDSGQGIACASCHPEATHDGRIWNFSEVGPRRTQPLGGGILSTAPFHWSGDVPDMSAVMTGTFVNRMGGQPPSSGQVDAIGRWLDGQPAPVVAPPQDPAAVSRGQALFTSSAAGCSGCHTGLKFTNNASVDVGTGGAFQVPMLLGLANGAPYLHNGCAPTLRDVFGPCGGSQHGHVSQLTAAQFDDLIAFLQTL